MYANFKLQCYKDNIYLCFVFVRCSRNEEMKYTNKREK